ncbi:hypothetical protein ACWFNE_15965 [Cellulomonas sp. NPDC055163]
MHTKTAVTPTPSSSPTAAGRYPWAAVLGVYALVATTLTAVAAWTWSTVPAVHHAPVQQGPGWLDAWYQYDAGWYYEIATTGYRYTPGQQSSIAFFPVYPLSVRGLGNLVGDHQVAAWVVAVLAGAASVLLFGRWAWARLSRPAALTALAVLMLYPYAFYLDGAMYADSTFLLSAIGAFVLLEGRRYWLAGLVGALATAGRPVGVAVAIGLVVRTLELLAQDRARAADPDAPAVRPSWRELVGAVRDVRLRQAGVLASVLGLVAWCTFLWLEFGNPVAFVEVESAPGWDQGVGPRTWFKVVYLGTLVNGPLKMTGLLTAQALACLCAVLLLPRVWRRLGWGYLAYAAVVLAIPIIGTKDFMGTGRYVLVAFPVMAVAGELLAEERLRRVRPVVLVLMGALLVTMTALFGRGVGVA